MAETRLKYFQFRRSFAPGYRPSVLAEGEPFIQYADQRIIYGGRDGQGRVEVPFAGTGGGGSGPASTDALPEGTSNLYFTQSRARAAFSAAGALAYNATTGVVSYVPPTLAAVATSGLYSDLTGRPTLAPVATSGSAGDLATGTLPAARLPTSGATAGSYGSGTLVPVITVDASGRITSVSTTPVSGGGSGGPSSTDALPEGATNLYYTAARARNAVSASGSLVYNASTGVFSYTAPTLAAVATSGSASDLGTGTLPAARLPAFTGDATSAAGTAALTLASTAVTAGSYGSASAVGTFTVDAKGRLTAAANTAIAIPSSAVTDAASANTVSVIVKRDASGNFSANVITANLTGNATTATSAGKLTTARTLSCTGDATGSFSFDGSADASVALTLATTGVTAGSYVNPNLTIDAKGRVTAATSGTASAKTNYAATVAPTVTDDASKGYSAGSPWLVPATGDTWRCRDATTGAARWVKTDTADHPGYNMLGKWFSPFNVGAPIAGSTLPTGSKYFFFGTIKQRTTLSQLQARVTTAASGGNFGMAVYNHDPIGGRISTLIANTGSGSTATAAPVSLPFSQGNQVLEPGNYWFGTEADNATAVFLAVGPSSFNHLASVGSVNGFGVNSTTQPCGLSVGGQTYGTWPADLSGVTQTDIVVARAPAIMFFVPTA